MDKITRFGMVQGRLTQSPPGCLQWFPQETWQDEFHIASDLGINNLFDLPTGETVTNAVL